jgi:metal-responsive CopG/Arc/MetJ family transcriptional regulator
MEKISRDTRFQVTISAEELAAVDDFRFKTRMPTRAAAVRELLRRGLEGYTAASDTETSEVDGA